MSTTYKPLIVERGKYYVNICVRNPDGTPGEIFADVVPLDQDENEGEAGAYDIALRHAELFAAAPAMLATLRNCVNVLRVAREDWPDDMEISKAYHDVCDVIQMGAGGRGDGDQAKEQDDDESDYQREERELDGWVQEVAETVEKTNIIPMSLQSEFRDFVRDRIKIGDTVDDIADDWIAIH